jgi:hypothetical protein
MRRRKKQTGQDALGGTKRKPAIFLVYERCRVGAKAAISISFNYLIFSLLSRRRGGMKKTKEQLLPRESSMRRR